MILTVPEGSRKATHSLGCTTDPIAEALQSCCVERGSGAQRFRDSGAGKDPRRFAMRLDPSKFLHMHAESGEGSILSVDPHLCKQLQQPNLTSSARERASQLPFWKLACFWDPVFIFSLERGCFGQYEGS